MMSSRYAPAVTVLLALALIPTIRNSYIDPHVSDGRSLQAIPMQLGTRYGSATERGTGWATTTLEAEEAIERRYGPDITLFAARSFDAKELYHHPELAVAYGRSFATSGVRPAAARPDLPLHWLSGSDAWAIYALAYGDGYVADPVRFELGRALGSVTQPRQPMTLFFAHGRGEAPADAEALLLAAIDSFHAARAPGR